MTDMLTVEALAYFDTPADLAKALGIKHPSLHDWGEYPPPLRQIQLERLTNGALKAEPNVFDTKKPEGAA